MNLRLLVEYALEALPQFFYADRGLFCHAITDWKTKAKIGESYRYTAMCMIGLSRAKRAGLDLPACFDGYWERIRHGSAHGGSLGDYGLAFWCHSLHNEKPQDRLRCAFLKRFEESRLDHIEVMETAWVLEGLARCLRLERDETLEKCAKQAAEAIIDLQDAGSGLFFNRLPGLPGMRRGWGSFNNQIYPIGALTTYWRLTKDDRTVAAAVAAARALCRLQGDFGEWAWIYDVRRGRVISWYPVFSVHQDGMAPMAFLELADAIDSDEFLEPAIRGMAWLFGNNEVGESVVDQKVGTIYRSIVLDGVAGKLLSHLDKMCGAVMGVIPNLSGWGPRTINRETRPYQLGWLINAWAGRDDLEQAWSKVRGST